MVDIKKLVHWFQCQHLFSLGLIIYVTNVTSPCSSYRFQLFENTKNDNIACLNT